MELLGQHTGRTDIPLTPAGEAAAAALAPMLARHHIVAAFCSPAQRAARTAQLAGLTDVKHDPDLWEWDYGGYEGLTTEQIQEQRPGWSLWRDGVIPGNAAHPGETVQQVGERADRVLARAEPLLPGGDVALVAHGHVLRVLTARWLQLDPSDGQAVPAGHRDGQHARLRARRAGHRDLERPARAVRVSPLRRTAPRRPAWTRPARVPIRVQLMPRLRRTSTSVMDGRVGLGYDGLDLRQPGEQLIIGLLVPGAEPGRGLLGDDQVAQPHAFVADVDARAWRPSSVTVSWSLLQKEQHTVSSRAAPWRRVSGGCHAVRVTLTRCGASRSS